MPCFVGSTVLDVGSGQGSFCVDIASKGVKRVAGIDVNERLTKLCSPNTDVVGLFPSIESVLRLVSVVLMETDERWLTGKRYLNMYR